MLQHQLDIRYVPTEEQTAHIMTKLLSQHQFDSFISKLTLNPSPFHLRRQVEAHPTELSVDD